MVGTFFFSSCVCILGSIFAGYLVPDTEELEQEEVWAIFGRHRDKKDDKPTTV